MKHPRMWMQVGVWPPVHPPWPSAARTQARRRLWIGAGVLVSAVVGATIGSVVTLTLIGQLGSVCS
ncbi:MAG: hypothetical protein KUG77_01130 [Nannocystaceae bacterium]|nr:hypothetical protein [Nannocystaceae bacterium]